MKERAPKLIWMDAPFEDLRNQLVANFETHPLRAEHPEFVTTRFFFTTTPSDAVSAPVLNYQQRTPLHLTFDTGEVLTGSLVWQSGLNTSLSQQILGSLALSDPKTGRVWRFQGFMAEFGPPRTTSSDDSGDNDGGNGSSGSAGDGGGDQPDDGNTTDDGQTGDHDAGGDGGSHDPDAGDAPSPDTLNTTNQGGDLRWDELFPFIYMKHWPPIEPGSLSDGFIEIPGLVMTASPFLKTLIDKAKKGDRAGQEAAAVDFVNPAAGAPDSTDNATPDKDASADKHGAAPAAAQAEKSEKHTEPARPDPRQDQQAKPASTPSKKSSKADKIAPETPTPGGFINTLDPLAPPFSAYPEMWPAIKELSEPTLPELTALVKARLGGWAAFKILVNAPDAKSELIRIWESVIALNLLAGWRRKELARLIEILVTHHVLTHALASAEGGRAHEAPAHMIAGPDEVKAWIDATLVLPAAIFAAPAPTAASHGGATHDAPLKLQAPGWVRPYSYGLARTIHYKPLGYELGEVQRIESILRGEMRETRNRHLSRRERRDTETSTTIREARRNEDTSVADLINQVQKTLADHVSTTHVNSYDTAYGLPTDGNKMSVTGNWWVQEQPAGGFARNALRFARDVVEKTVRRLARETRYSRSVVELEETESTDLTRFDNRKNATDVRGIYRWVNRTFRLRTRNLGEVMIFEIMVPHPGRRLTRHIRRYWKLDLSPPRSPRAFGISDYQSLTDTPPTDKQPSKQIYYLDAFEQFGVSDPLPPPSERLLVSESIQSRTPVAEGVALIPAGYEPVEAQARIVSVGDPASVQVIVGSAVLLPEQSGTDDAKQPNAINGQTAPKPKPLRLPAESSGGLKTLSGPLSSGASKAAPPADEGHPLSFTVLCDVKPKTDGQPDNPSTPSDMPLPDAAPMDPSSESTGFFAMSLEIQCQRTDEAYADWRYRAYRLIQDGYDRQLAEYRAQMARQVDAIEAENPGFLTKAVTSETVSAAMEQIVDLSGSETDAISPDYAKPRIQHYLQQTVGWSDIATFLDIDDQGLDACDEMSDDIALRDFLPDLRFRDFLRAQRVRVLAPVNRGTARSFLYFLRTGRIWPDADDLAPCLPEDAEIVTHLKAEPKSEQEEAAASWTVRVPTHMSMLSPEAQFPEQDDLT